MQRRISKRARAIIALALVAGMLLTFLPAFVVHADVVMAEEDDQGNVIVPSSKFTLNQGFNLSAEGDSGSSGGGGDITSSYSFIVAKDVMGNFSKNTSLSTTSQTVYDSTVAPMIRWNKPYNEKFSDKWQVADHTNKNITVSIYCDDMNGKTLESTYLKSDGSIDYDKLWAAYGDSGTVKPGLVSRTATSDGYAYSISSSLFSANSGNSAPVYFADPNSVAIGTQHKTEASTYDLVYEGEALDQVAQLITDYDYNNGGAIADDGSINAIASLQDARYFVSRAVTLRAVTPAAGYYDGTLCFIFSCT